MSCPECLEDYIATDSHYDESNVLVSEINKCRMIDCGFEWSPVNLQNEFYRCPVCANPDIWKDIKNPEKQGCHSCGSQFELTSVEYEKEDLIKEIGDQMVSLSKEQAEDLREYIIKEHGLVVGHLEKIVGIKSMDKDDEYACFYYSDEWSHYFRGPGGSR